MKTVAIIGAGAAGCFAAIEIKRRHPDVRVVVCEGASRPLAKVAITGGGRCNLTNTFARVSQQSNGLKEVYPRGDKLLRRALSVFSHRDVWEWFEREGVRLVAQEDECVFPQSQDAMQIVNTLLRLMDSTGVELRLRHRVARLERMTSAAVEPASVSVQPACLSAHPASVSVQPASVTVLPTTLPVQPAAFAGYRLTFSDVALAPLVADRVLVAAGGHPRAKGFDFLAPLGLKVEPPVPSLFTFNLAGHWHTSLMGAVVEDAVVTLAGTKFRAAGPLLLTHWGMSGPAILRLSSYAARHLEGQSYKGRLVVNWLGGANDETVRSLLKSIADAHPRKLITTTPPSGLTARFWQSLLERCGVISASVGSSGPDAKPAPIPRWAELGKKPFSRIVTALTADEHEITGRCAFKEEFVTCGGVALSEINPNTMEARKQPGLFFAGEFLDIDALTGGFNLQAAWSTGYVAALNILK